MILAAVGMLREAKIVRRPGVRPIAGGARAELLARRLEAAYSPDVTGVVSIGLCGALDPGLRVGDLVIGAEVIATDSRRPTDADWRARLTSQLPKARLAPVLGLDIAVVKARDKARLWTESGAPVVDMESHVAARFAAAHDLRLAVLRVVSDPATADLPPAVLCGIKPDGAMNLMGVMAALARRPGQLPDLIRAGDDADNAFKALKAAWAACDLG
jgi:hopanoid-associated phosphorylase